jgi:TIR domain-containing protein
MDGTIHNNSQITISGSAVAIGTQAHASNTIGPEQHGNSSQAEHTQPGGATGEVFINYRGAGDSLYAAGLLHTGLSHALGLDRVFLDSESIKPGADFVETLVERVRAARVVLAIIGPRWLTATDVDGGRRIDDPNDWIRRELVEAFDAGVPVIPVLTDNTRMPTDVDLPADIARLGRAQYVLLRQRHARADIAFLLDKLADLGVRRQSVDGAAGCPHSA